MNRLKNKIETLIDNSQYSEAVELVRNEFDFSFEAEFLENNYHFSGDKDKIDLENQIFELKELINNLKSEV